MLNCSSSSLALLSISCFWCVQSLNKALIQAHSCNPLPSFPLSFPASSPLPSSFPHTQDIYLWNQTCFLSLHTHMDKYFSPLYYFNFNCFFFHLLLSPVSSSCFNEENIVSLCQAFHHQLQGGVLKLVEVEYLHISPGQKTLKLFLWECSYTHRDRDLHYACTHPSVHFQI